MTQKLSENRTGAVRDSQLQQGVGGNRVSATGFRNRLLQASNDHSAGRLENRMVELIVSGDAIGSRSQCDDGKLALDVTK